ncbi:diguanylate cyclase [Denitromonas sp. IR12]|uniref:Diguanylate cyclase n=2 Tax=Denitromonas iodatirespirans TaxID=2795389 RepID=A0A944DED6_DENI1|nr:diguanylate cyclase [Denitromonas iodatirespirans]
MAALAGVALARAAGVGPRDQALAAAGAAALSALAILGAAHRRAAEGARLRLIAETCAGVEVALAPDGRLQWISPAVESLTGYSPANCYGAPDLIALLVEPLDQDYARTLGRQALRGEAGEAELRARHRDGESLWVLCRWRPVCDASGAVIMFRLSISSAQARKSAELTLLETVAALRRAQGLSEHYLARSRDEQQRLRALLDVIDLGILFVDADRRVRYTNPALERIWSFSDGRDGLLGMRDERLLARAVSQLVAPEAYRRHVAETRGQRGRSAPFEMAFLNGRKVREVSTMVTASGGSRSLGRLWVFEDVTEQRKAAEALVRLAERDPLTNLYNRRRFQDSLGAALAGAQRGQSRIGLIMFDLDGFKPINDRLGHQAGDKVLVSVARAIRRVVRRNEQLFRVGGDEFAILVAEADETALQELAQRVVTEVGGIEMEGAKISASVGYASYPDDADSENALVAAADSAMYRAKSAGKNCWQTCAARKPDDA